MRDGIPVRAGILSDFTVYNEEISLSTFKNLLVYGKPNSYTTFKKFNEGDYTYEKAKYKLRINRDNAAIGKLEVIIDVPDIVDSGYSTTKDDTDTFQTVMFTKRFSITPQVNAIILRADKLMGAYIEYAETTTDFFKYRIIGPDGSINGDVSWIAKSY